MELEISQSIMLWTAYSNIYDGLYCKNNKVGLVFATEIMTVFLR